MNEKEKELVSILTCYPNDKMSYNLVEGGCGGNKIIWNDEHRNKVSTRFKGKSTKRKGTKLPDYWKEKIAIGSRTLVPFGNKKALDISKYSVYPEQKEALVQGKFVVKKVENIKNIKEPSNFGKSFEEYRFIHKDRFEDFTSKKGKKMIRDKQTGKTYSQEQYNTGYFTNDGKYMNYSDFNSLLEEKRPKGFSRQIVTIEQI